MYRNPFPTYPYPIRCDCPLTEVSVGVFRGGPCQRTSRGTNNPSTLNVTLKNNTARWPSLMHGRVFPKFNVSYCTGRWGFLIIEHILGRSFLITTTTVGGASNDPSFGQMTT